MIRYRDHQKSDTRGYTGTRWLEWFPWCAWTFSIPTLRVLSSCHVLRGFGDKQTAKNSLTGPCRILVWLQYRLESLDDFYPPNARLSPTPPQKTCYKERTRRVGIKNVQTHQDCHSGHENRHTGGYILRTDQISKTRRNSSFQDMMKNSPDLERSRRTNP